MLRLSIKIFLVGIPLKSQKMLDLFRAATSFNQNISEWDTSSATSMSKMFENATSFNQDISSWCVSNFITEPENFATNFVIGFRFSFVSELSAIDPIFP